MRAPGSAARERLLDALRAVAHGRQVGAAAARGSAPGTRSRWPQWWQRSSPAFRCRTRFALQRVQVECHAQERQKSTGREAAAIEEHEALLAARDARPERAQQRVGDALVRACRRACRPCAPPAASRPRGRALLQLARAHSAPAARWPSSRATAWPSPAPRGSPAAGRAARRRRAPSSAAPRAACRRGRAPRRRR